jgi:hypothetical protein
MYMLTIVGTRVTNSCMSHELEGMTHYQIAQRLLKHRSDAEKLPDSTEVQLIKEREEEYTPPRCRKPRTRYIEEVVATYTLGDFRRQP